MVNSDMEFDGILGVDIPYIHLLSITGRDESNLDAYRETPGGQLPTRKAHSASSDSSLTPPISRVKPPKAPA